MLDDLELLNRLLSYDPETGILTWRVKRRSPKDVGRAAGFIGSDGYMSITILNKQYKAHRVAWVLVHGRLPVGDVDHIDGNRTNNRLANLREVSRCQTSKTYVRRKK